MKRIVLTALAFVLLAAPMAQAESLRMLSGFPENFIFSTDLGAKYIELVKKGSNGQMDIKFFGPDTIPTFEQFEPVQSGVFDILFTHPAYHSGTTAVGLAMDAIAVDPQKRRDSGVFEFIDQHYQKRGMKLIAAPATGSKGFNFYLRKPIKGTPGLEGMKIRGTVSYHPMIRALGGVPVNMPGGDVYTALQKGVVDGAAWGRVGAKDFKWYEVSKYIATPSFGQAGVMIFMNLDKFNKLSDAQRKTLLDAGVALEKYSIEHFNKLAEQEFKDLTELGMQETRFDPKDAGRLESLWAEGVWTVAEEKSGADAKKLRELAKKQGMTY